MDYLLVTVLIWLSPAILVVSLTFPFYWIGQYRLLRRSGSWPLQGVFHRRWMGFMGRGILVVYLLVLGGIFLPGLFPTVHRFLAGGWFLLVFIPVAVDLAILMALSPDLAVEKWRAEQPPRS